MTQMDLFKLLAGSGYPVAHIEFKGPPTVPYIAYLFPDEKYRGSDFENNIVERQVRIELYTEYKDKYAEKKLDDILRFTPFTKYKSKIPEEKLMMIVYEYETVEKIIGGQ